MNRRVKELENEIKQLKEYLRKQEDERIRVDRAQKYRLSMLGAEDMRPNFAENIAFKNNMMVVVGELPGLAAGIVIDEYMEYTVADWNKDGVAYTYVQQYTDEPSVYVGLQGDDVANELDTYSFIMVAEHVKDLDGNYVGVKVYPQGSNIPTTFSGKITIHAICKGLVGDDEGNGDETAPLAVKKFIFKVPYKI